MHHTRRASLTQLILLFAYAQWRGALLPRRSRTGGNHSFVFFGGSTPDLADLFMISAGTTTH